MKIAALLGGLVFIGFLYYGVVGLLEWVEKANKSLKKKEDKDEN